MRLLQWKLLGESIREIGVLILVFVPLDVWLAPSSPAGELNYPEWLQWARFLSANHWRILLFGLVGIVMLYYGIRIEAKASLALNGQNGGN